MSGSVLGPISPMAGAQGATGATGGTGPTGPGTMTPHRLDTDGATVNAAGASQVVQWATAALASDDRIVAIRSGLWQPLAFTVPDGSKTIWLEVLNDNTDVLYQRAIDDGHYTPDPSTNGVGALPLVVGPYDAGTIPVLTIQIRTDAASLSLVAAGSGIVWCELEIATMAPTVTINPTPVFP